MVDESETFSVELESTVDDVLHVHLGGEFDVSEADWVEETLSAAAPHHRRMEVDLSDVSFIDSAGLRALVTLKQRAGLIGLVMSYANPSEEVCRTLKAAGIDELVELSPPVSDELS